MEDEFPGTVILPHVNLGNRLSDLHDQEPYSYRLGVVYMGGRTQQTLLDNFRRCKESLGFRIRPEYPSQRYKGRKYAMQEEGAPKLVTSFPYETEIVEHTWIPMRDGIRLSARIWRPKAVNQKPVPAILEYTPFRKRDHTRCKDEMAYNYLAGHGYVCLKVDIRGSGESEGILEDKYLPQEQEDGIDTLKWIVEQQWNNGSVGMVGISWGGSSALQIAAQRPPELKAVITICSTDDRYNADAHYLGGAMLADNLSWASIMFAQNTQPPDPEIVGEQWFELWLKRLKGNGLWLEKWMRHPWRDEYWKHGSVGEDYSTIQCPVLAVGGWADGYSNAIFRLLENLKVPRKGIIGPWSHTYPYFGKPGPAIGFLQESLRWWNYWLKGIDTGVATDPDLVVYMLDYSRPGASVTHRAGSWLALPSWPCEKIKQLSFFLDEEGGLNPNAGSQPEKRTYKVQSPLSVGLLGGKWCSYSTTPDLPQDQHEDDGGSLIFESKPLRSNLSILGTPAIQLEIASNKPVAMIAVRLSDVSPDDKATRISYGLLNLTHRNSHETPEPLKPGNRYHVRIELNEIAQTVPRGHRIRIAISSSYFPVAWPSPEPVRLSIFSGESHLIIPYIPRDAEKSMTTAFREPLVGPCSLTRQIKKPERGWFIKRDMMNETTTVEVLNDEGKIHYEDTGLDIATRTTEKYSYQYNDYNSLRGETHCDIIFEREGWKVETMTRTILTSGKHRFKIRATLDAYLNGSRVFSNSWDESIPRKLL